MKKELLDSLSALYEKRTPGVWVNHNGYRIKVGDDRIIAEMKYLDGTADDVDLIVAVVNALPMLLENARRVEDALDRIRELEDLICEAAPLSWASYGFPRGTEPAYDWEKKAKGLVTKFPGPGRS